MAHGNPRRELPTRESLDSPGDEELRTQLRGRLPPGGGDTSPPARQEAADPTGSVAVTVDARGRVTDVQISQGWRNRLGMEEFAGAVFEAYSAASQQAAEAFALATLAAEEAGVDPPSVSEEVLELPAEPKRPQDPEEWLVWIHERFARIREKVDRTAATLSPGQADRTGPYGNLTATLQGRSVVGIAGDPGQIWYADTGRLREEALAVLSTAVRPEAGPGS